MEAKPHLVHLTLVVHLHPSSLCKITVKVHERNVNSCIFKIWKFHPSSFYQLITNSVASIEKNTLPHLFNHISIIICYFEFLGHWHSLIFCPFQIEHHHRCISFYNIFIVRWNVRRIRILRAVHGIRYWYVQRFLQGWHAELFHLDFSSVSKVCLIYLLVIVSVLNCYLP